MRISFLQRLGIFLAFVAACVFSTKTSLANDRQLTEVRSPNFRVLTDGSESQGRKVAHEFEEMRAVFATGFPTMRLSGGAPLLIFAVQDENGLKAMAPGKFKTMPVKPGGLFTPGPERQFAIVRLDQVSSRSYSVVYHEYVHSLLHLNFRWLPTWLDEGLAEFYGSTRFEGKKIYVGAPTREVNYLQGRTLIPLETLLKVHPYVFFRGDEKQIATFYAESWALVHYTIFGPDMERGKKLARFYNQLQAGENQVKAFREAFGDLKTLENALDRYIGAFAFQSWEMESPASIQEKDFPARKMSKAESMAEIASFRLWNRDEAEARPLVEEALKQDPNLAVAHEEMGFIYFQDGQDQDALREFSRAYELDKQRYLSQYFATMLAAHRDTAERREVTRAGLLETTKINPDFAHAYAQLAKLEIADNHASQAFTLSRKAEELQPSVAGYHLLSGEILLRLKKEKAAAEYAKWVAERWESSDHNEAVALWNRIPEASRPAGVTVAEEVEPQSKSVDGIIRSVTCGEKESKDVLLQHGDEVLSFRSKGAQRIGFSDTIWYGINHLNLCHHTEGLHAVVRDRPAVGNQYTGDWLWIELRDELSAASDHDAPKDSTAKKESAPSAQP
jgi:tetratricopeptide (TPR) repeat protein